MKTFYILKNINTGKYFNGFYLGKASYTCNINKAQKFETIRNINISLTDSQKEDIDGGRLIVVKIRIAKNQKIKKCLLMYLKK